MAHRRAQDKVKWNPRLNGVGFFCYEAIGKSCDYCDPVGIFGKLKIVPMSFLEKMLTIWEVSTVARNRNLMIGR